MPSNRLYFLIGDWLANVGMGALTGWAVAGLIPPSWGMLAGMLAGMAVGMIISFLLLPPLVILLGALEVMIPVMIAAMLAGMGVAMARAMGHLPPGMETMAGAILGMLALLFTWGMHLMLRGEVNHE